MEADLQDVGIDIRDPDLHRSWPWLRVRVLGLLTRLDSRINRLLIPMEVPGGPPAR